MEKESDYIERGPRTIMGHLTDMVKRKCILSAHFDRNQSFLTTIVDINPETKTLAVDCAPNEQLNKSLLVSAKVLFRTEVEGVKASFAAKKIHQTKVGEHQALVMDLPDSMFWLQRREFYRVKIPLSHESTLCEIRFITEYEDGETEEQVGQFRVLDISTRGFSLLSTQECFQAFLQPEQDINHCTLMLNDGNYDRVEFQVRYNNEIRVNPNTMHFRVGCMFTQISHTFEHSIQRYMQSIELQKKTSE
jgi:flagellar brake protein